MRSPFLFDFMFPHYKPITKVLVVSEKEYQKQKSKTVAREKASKLKHALEQLKTIQLYKNYLTAEMSKITLKEEEITLFKKSLEDLQNNSED
jgi:hypothetical protein